MRVLGIDPGTRLAGYGVVDGQQSRFHHVDNGVLVPKPSWPIPRRLAYLQGRLRDVLTEFKPDCVAVEEAFVAKNPQTALKLGMARGVFFAECVQAGLDVYEYAPAMVKKSVSGGGRATKDQVQQMVRILLGLPEVAEENASDALAVALCHLQHFNPVLEALKK